MWQRQITSGFERHRDPGGPPLDPLGLSVAGTGFHLREGCRDERGCSLGLRVEPGHRRLFGPPPPQVILLCSQD